MRRVPLALSCAVIPLVIYSVGCSSGRNAGPRLHSVAGLYDQASLEYRLGPQQLSGPLAVTHVEGQLVSFQMQSEEQLPQGANGTLRLQYPHPDAPAEHVRATVIIQAPHASAAAQKPTTNDGWWSRARGWIPGGSAKSSDDLYEEWVLDVPRSELDLVLSELNASQYFTERPAKAEAAQLAVNIDGSQLTRGWDQSERLNTLILKVRSQGQLVRYSCPPRAADNK